MSREDSCLSILKAAAKIQYNVALILEAKAIHAEKSRNWICHHLSTDAYENHAEQVKKSHDIHEQLIAVIHGITKMEEAFAKNLEILIGEKEDTSGAGAGGGLGNMFGLGGGLEK
ncbi:hypothetical protein SAMN04487897_103277 [Paenibacillus sp. yr247]|uniref:restriction endonuclease subunit S n=1 Tax=Paenibacillus sp. yr247 TaxID=1761880 RepID=UPI000889581C|nr:restriction endonuclease subunit S [Paenibacillus sp. yr247]SDN59430.1 hypothetical protein SAMN04487897_103277 [Paenibacillus sp. yr247]